MLKHRGPCPISRKRYTNVPVEGKINIENAGCSSNSSCGWFRAEVKLLMTIRQEQLECTRLRWTRVKSKNVSEGLWIKSLRHLNKSWLFKKKKLSKNMTKLFYAITNPYVVFVVGVQQSVGSLQTIKTVLKQVNRYCNMTLQYDSVVSFLLQSNLQVFRKMAGNWLSKIWTYCAVSKAVRVFKCKGPLCS